MVSEDEIKGGEPAMANADEQAAGQREVSRMDDFQVVAERRRVMANLATLTDRYRELNQEINRRDTLRWMLAR